MAILNRNRYRSTLVILKRLALAIGLIETLVLTVLAVSRWRMNGWGSLGWLAAFVAILLIRLPHALRDRANVVVIARKSLAEMTLLVAMFLTMMVLPYLQLATGVFVFADYWLPRWASATGVLAQLPFLWLFWRSYADLGRNWSARLEVRRDHGLVMTGVYARIRHPMYTALWISALAQPLLIHNWIAGALVVPAWTAFWFLRVPNEEAMMRQAFGTAYDEYCRKAGRLFPKRA